MTWRSILAALARRGEMPDPVDAHWRTAAAALCPDELLGIDEDNAWQQIVESYRRPSYIREES